MLFFGTLHSDVYIFSFFLSLSLFFFSLLFVRPNTTHKYKLKWIEDPNVRSEIIKLLEENIDRILFAINHSKILYEPLPRIMEIKTNINKWDVIKLKSFCTVKETISKARRQPSE